MGTTTDRSAGTAAAPREEAIEHLYRARLGAFVRVATAITGDRDTGRDAVQEAFAGVLSDPAALRDDSALEAWVWTAVVNRARNQRRGRRRRSRREDGDARLDDVVASPATAPDPAIRAMVARLPDRQRLVLFLRHYADMDYATIATVVGIRIGTVGATLSAAHATLREQIEQEEG